MSPSGATLLVLFSVSFRLSSSSQSASSLRAGPVLVLLHRPPPPAPAQQSEAGVPPGAHDPGGLWVLTVGLHQVHLHVVRDQGVWQFREKALHGPRHGVHREVLFCQIQVVI